MNTMRSSITTGHFPTRWSTIPLFQPKVKHTVVFLMMETKNNDKEIREKILDAMCKRRAKVEERKANPLNIELLYHYRNLKLRHF